MINYRIGSRASGKTFRLLRELSGKEYVFVEPYKYKALRRKKLIKENKKHNHYGDMTKAKVTTILDYMNGNFSNIDIVVIEDFNDFILSIFKDKQVYININHKSNRVKFINVDEEIELWTKRLSGY